MIGPILTTRFGIVHGVPLSNTGGRSVGHGIWTEVKEGVEYREDGSMKVSRNVGSV